MTAAPPNRGARPRWRPALALLALAVAGVAALRPPGEGLRSGWGVDGCLSCHPTPADFPAALAQARRARLTYVRDRSPGDFWERKNRAAGRVSRLRKIRAAGLNVVAFVNDPRVPGAHPRQDTPADLFPLYQMGWEIGSRSGDLVQAWEMIGEPDNHYAKDPPEQVAAAQKAIYLGIKDGARRNPQNPEPGVLMGALFYAPGPWLERAAQNRIFDYTDGLNIHFYGHARGFESFVRAQEAFAARFSGARRLPGWVTEIGLDPLPPDDPLQAHGRALQRDFTLATAKVAQRLGVAVFMPFLLVGSNGDYGGHVLLRSPEQPFPAWDAYVEFTRRESLPAGPALAPPASPGRLVLHWLPDHDTCLPHKVSGMYWLWRSAEHRAPPGPITGHVALHNFSFAPIQGVLRAESDNPGISVRIGPPHAPPSREEIVVRVPPQGRMLVPVTIAVPDRPYREADIRLEFRTRGGRNDDDLVFAVGTRPDPSLVTEERRIEGSRPTPEAFDWIWAPEPLEVTSAAGPWLGINGVEVTALGSGKGNASAGSLSAPGWSFRVTAPPGRTTAPPMAVTRVEGLPPFATGFLRLRYDSAQIDTLGVRVDLVDRFGQRWNIVEHYGRNAYEPGGPDVFLRYADFQRSAWGTFPGAPRMDPRDIREIQLRFFPDPEVNAARVQLDAVSFTAPDRKGDATDRTKQDLPDLGD